MTSVHSGIGWAGRTSIQSVFTEMSLNVLAFNFKRVFSVLGVERTRKAMQLWDAYAPFALAQGLINGRTLVEESL